jgi:SAM-dependent methyltransferase
MLDSKQLPEVIDTMTGIVHLDLPSDGIIKTPYDQLWGWILVRVPVVDLRITSTGHDVPYARIYRDNLNPHQHVGFSIYIDLPALVSPGRVPPNELIVQCWDKTFLIAEIILKIEGVSDLDLDFHRANQIKKRQFVERNSKAPPRLHPGCRAVSALPDKWDISPLLSQKHDAVSSHFYGPTVQDFIKQFGEGAMILDAGAGFRKLPYKNVVNLEIYDYPSTDILATGDDLPFCDGTFDAVLSLAVLEHVRDPFGCAREIKRVLKPGGKVLAMIPFLQAEHGYPSHYFNATRFGVRELFRDLTMEAQFLDPSNHPIFTVNQILGIYAAGLSEQTSVAFLAMTVGDLLSRAPQDWGAVSFVAELSPAAAWLVAWGTSTIFSKS